MNEIYETQTFRNIFSKLPNDDKLRIERIKDQLQKSSNVGKPLGFEWFREKRVNGKRLYYLIYVEVVPTKILLVVYANKKKQQDIIDFVKENKKSFEKYLRDNYRTL